MEIDLIVNVSNGGPMTPTLRYEAFSSSSSSGLGGAAAAAASKGYDDEFSLAMSLPEALFASVTLSIVTVATIIGNILVILSVFTYKPLRIAQNFFLVSLAVADLTVAVLVLPFNITQSLMGRWTFGLPLCEMWLTCDVLCCTASILNLCAIALDRYWAIHDPINYAQKRTLKRVVVMILLVWVISCIICLPPLFGWNDWTHDFNEYSQCKLTSQRGYVIYSACGSFFIPLIVMATVYFKIFVATKRRLRERAKNTAAVAIVHLQSSCSGKFCKSVEPSSLPPNEANHNDLNNSDDSPSEAGLATPRSMANEKESVSEVQLHLHKVDSKASENSPIHQFIEERQKISLSKERRAARILGIVMGVFVVCWLPFFLMYVVVPFCKRCSLSYRLENFITWMGYMNSSLNPVIYTIFNIDFRRAFTRLLRCNSPL